MTTALDVLASEVHLSYGYDMVLLRRLVSQFSALDSLWETSYEMENLDFPGWSPGGAILPRLHLGVKRLNMESPLWIELVVSGAGSGAGAFALRLFVRALRDPQRLASWLPTFVESWHSKWAEADDARVKHAQARSRRLVELSHTFEASARALPGPDDIEVIGLPQVAENLPL